MDTRQNALGQPVGAPLEGWSPRDAPRRAILSGRSVRLEPVLPERHLDALWEAAACDAEGRMWTYLPYGPFPSRAAYADWMQETCLADDPLFFAIVDAVSGSATGLASFLRIEKAAGVVEVGHLQFSPRLQRTTAATEAMVLMMRHVFADLGYRRYEWKCDALNAASRRAALRLGFRFEGIFRQATLYKGRNRDTAWYSILDSEWPALEAAFERWLAPANFDVSGRQLQPLRAAQGS